ncbi:MAG: DUF4192 family protein [Microbacterium sp.]|uniref:DUF4192 family protein n=1 Tax=Microbacterium sp. TaxID=51671 RepID=UPI002718BD23|nr:DUF4192 family protein [Microbacterium sp.]MDO8383728.1 DUF4192 family protein [Microbacterium sp.]
MPTIIKASDAADFLALVPALAGYRPRQSLALVLFRGKRTAGVMRYDLPEPGAVEAMASTTIGLACKVDRIDGIAIVVYTDEGFRDDSSGPIAWQQLVTALEKRAHVCGLRVVEALCVAGDAWGSYEDAEARPLSEVQQREADLPLQVPVGDQGAGAYLPEVDLAEKERLGRALLAIDDAAEVLLAAPADSEDGDVSSWARLDPRALAAVVVLDDLPELFEDALRWDPEELDPFSGAVLLWCLRRPALRDVALQQWAGDIHAGELALFAQVRWEAGQEYPEELGARFCGEGPRPDPARLHRARNLVRRIAAAAPRDARPGPLAAAAWLSWALGGSTHAGWYAERALEIDPGHGLSQIVMSMCAASHLPEWAFARE